MFRSILLLPILLAPLVGCGEDAAPTAPGAASSAMPSAAPGADASFEFLTFSRLQGYGEGIPCTADSRPTTPLAAAADLRAELAAGGAVVRLVSIGDATLQAPTIPRNAAAVTAARARAEVILDAMAEAGVDIYVPGHGDFMFGIAGLLDRAAERGLPVLASNMQMEGRDDILQVLMLEQNGIRTACLAVLSEPTEDALERSQAEGVTFEAPARTVRRMSRQLVENGEADMVVVFSGLDLEGNQKLCGTSDNPTNAHFIIGTSTPGLPAERVTRRYASAMMTMRTAGRELGWTTLEIVDGSFDMVDLAPLHVLPEEIERNRERLAEYEAKFGTRDPHQLAGLVAPGREGEFIDQYTLIEANAEWIGEFEGYAGSFIDHQRPDLPPVGPDHSVTRILAGQGAAMHQAIADADLSPPTERSYLEIIDPEQDCRECHEAQYSFWAGTAHARSHESLLTVNRELDSSCLICHATGFNEKGGFKDPRLGAPFGGVTCFNCHVAQRPHAVSRRYRADPGFMRSKAEFMECGQCHVAQRSPDFERETAMQQVTCPPMDPGDPIIRHERLKSIEVLEGLREEGDWGDRDGYLEGRLHLRLGNVDEGLRLIQTFASGNPDNPAIAREIAVYLDDHGMSLAAQEVLAEFLAKVPGDVSTNIDYVNLLLEPTDPSARDPDRAVDFLALLLPDGLEIDGTTLPLRLLQVDALFAAGRDAEGGARLRQCAQAMPNGTGVQERLSEHLGL